MNSVYAITGKSNVNIDRCCFCVIRIIYLFSFNTATRAKLLKIDSQGYATVIPAGELDDDEVDCLRFSDSDIEECPVDPSNFVCRDDEGDGWRSHRENGYAPLTPKRTKEAAKSASILEEVDEDRAEEEINPPSPESTTPQDYEVPMNILQQSPNRNSSVVSPRLTRQRAVSSTSEDEPKRLSCVSRDGSNTIQREEEEEGKKELETKVKDTTITEEVLDSGIENSVDSQNTLQTSTSVEVSAANQDKSQSKPGPVVAGREDASSSNIRPRSMTVFPVVGQYHIEEGKCNNNPLTRPRSETVTHHERQSSMPLLVTPKALHISLDQKRQVIV